jgi:hypothetical protein
VYSSHLDRVDDRVDWEGRADSMGEYLEDLEDLEVRWFPVRLASATLFSSSRFILANIGCMYFLYSINDLRVYLIIGPFHIFFFNTPVLYAQETSKKTNARKYISAW